MMKGIPRLARKAQVAIHRAGLEGQKHFPVLLLDGAAPSENCQEYLDVCHGATFRNLLPKLLKLAPLSRSAQSPVSFHQPDPADWATYPPEVIREQWRPLLLQSAPNSAMGRSRR